MLRILFEILEALQPIVKPLCFVVAWGFLVALGWGVIGGVRDAIAKSKKMHQIPCTRCQFFTNDYRLKCTIQPDLANTEQAIGCFDYRPKPNPFF